MTRVGFIRGKTLIAVTTVVCLSAAACASSVPTQTASEGTTESLGMPDLRCMDLSKAKDLLRDISQGRYSVESSDASADDRMQLVDSNWVVVEQDPLPGESLIDEPKVAVLKDAEASACADAPADKPTPTTQAQQIASDTPSIPTVRTAEATPSVTASTRIERPTLPPSTATPAPASPTSTSVQVDAPSDEPLDTLGVPVDASRLSSATVQHILLAESGAWTHPDYRAVTAMFNAYAATLNRRDFESAILFFSTSLWRSTRLETFAAEHQSSVSPIVVESITGNGIARQVRVRYVSTSEQPTLDCKEWAVDYELVQEGERWRIDGSTSVPNSPVPCSGLADYDKPPQWYSLTVTNWANLRDAPDGETIAEVAADELLYPNGEERWGTDARWTAVSTADGRQGWMANFLLRPHFSDNAIRNVASTPPPTQELSPEPTVQTTPRSPDPTPLPTMATGPSQAQPFFSAESDNNCVAGYSPCIEPGPDVDCAGGSGNGPRYESGPISVTGSDPYDLDRDGDGIGCE